MKIQMTEASIATVMTPTEARALLDALNSRTHDECLDELHERLADFINGPDDDDPFDPPTNEDEREARLRHV